MKHHRFLGIFLTVFALATLLCIITPKAEAATVASGTCGAEGDNLTWTLDDEGTLTISGTGAMAKWTSSNSAPWYSYRSSVKTVNIKSGVTTIGSSAFYYSDLTSVTIPDSVTTIGSDAFYYCTDLTSVTIPDSVTTIGNSAFYYCSGLTSVTIGKGVTYIAYGAFKGCEKLSTINMLDCVPDIEGTAFNDTAWYNAQPDGVLYLGKIAYKIKGTAPSSVTIKYGTLSINQGAFNNCTNLTSVTIPDSVTTIGVNAFNNCTNLTSVTIPDSLTTIGDKAFYYCKNLTSVTGGNSVCSVGKDAFSYTAWFNNQPDGLVYIGKTAYQYKGTCPASVVIEEGTLGIGGGAFYRCTGLTSVTIPDSVTTIGNDAFYNCTGLTIVTIPDSVTIISNYAFYYCTGLTTVTMPDSVTTIGNYAFYNCNSLSAITIPDSVITIGNYAFQDCSGLTSVDIPNNVTTIGSSAFSYCKNLTDVNIGSSVNTIASNAFTGCNNIIGIRIDQNNKMYSCDDRGVLFNKSKSHIVGFLGNISGEYVIPDSVTTIGESAFYSCSGLTSVTIGENVTSIGQSAFYRCTKLTEIRFNAVSMDDLSHNSSLNDVFSFAGQSGTGIKIIVGSKVTRIPDYLFRPNSTESSYVPKIISIEFEKGGVCKDIGSYAFYMCTRLTSVTIPDSVTTIDDYAFYRCSGLTSVTIGESVTSVGRYAFSGCTGLTELVFNAVNMDDLESTDCVFSNAGQNGTGIKMVVGKKVTKLPAYLFYSSSKLVSIEFAEENSCRAIGDAAFSGCIDLTSVDIPDTITLIGSGAFHGTTWYNNQPDGLVYVGKVAYTYKGNCLDTIVLEAGTLGISGSAFSGCTGLTAIDIPNSVISVGVSAFKNCSGLTSVTIPESVSYIGDAAFYGCTGLTEINFYATNILDMESTAFYAAGKNGAGIKLTIGEQVTRIPAYMFGINSTSSSYAPKITTVEFIGNSKCTSIGQYAFYNCDSLTAIAIPDSIQEIEAYAFNDCGSLYTIDLPQKPIIIRPYAFHKSGYYMQYYKYAMVAIDNHVVYILTSHRGVVEIPEGVITIADSAASSSQIGAVILPESLIRIGDRAFAGCRNLDEIIIPESVEYIGNNAFSSTSIQAIHIPAATVHLGEEFVIRGGTETTEGIKGITVAEGNPVYHSFEGSLIKTKEQVLWIGGSGIPDDGSVTTIASGAFRGDQSLSRVIPDGITTIGAGAFASCKMNTLYLPASVTEIQKDAFSSCNQLRYVYYSGDKASWDDLMEKEPHENLMKANVHFSIESDVELENEYTHTLIVPEGYTGIYTVEDLYNIRNDLNGKYILMNHIVFKSEDYEDGGICHSGYGWLPIGASADAPFTGVIDGNGYCIVNLCIDYSLVNVTASDPYVGLVGCNAGLICNLGILNGKITNNTGPVYCDLYVGSIAGYNVGTIENCFNNARISGTTNRSGTTAVGVYVGGIVGYSENGGSIVRCRNYGAVSASGFGSNVSSASACAAGIAGYANVVLQCANYGNVSASTSDRNKSIAAGVVGFGGAVKDCSNSGSINAANAAGISYEATSISYCYNSGNIRAEGENEIYAGGIAIQNASVVSCGNIGMVSSAASVLEVSGPNMCAYAGGIIVKTSKQVRDCFNAGKVSAYSGNGGSSIAHAGGISAVYTAQSMINCYNIGTVPINQPAYYKYCGDLAGYGGFDATGCVYVGDNAIGYGGSAQNAIQSDLESMKDKTIYKDFDFDSVWTMDTDAEYPYPTIQGQKMSCSIKLLGIAITEYPQKLSYNRGEKLSLEGLKVYAYYTDGASQPIVHYDIIGNTANQGKNTIVIDYFGARTTFDVYANTPSWDGSEIGGYVQLQNDTDVNIGLNADLYIDLNGFDLTGTIETNGYKIYGMDSTTDSYTCDAIGYFNCVDENGKAIIPVTHFKSDITGSVKRYMAIKDGNGYSFHRFYLGITHLNLKPGTTGVGYKAVFYGDEMVAANLDSFGYTMTLGDRTPLTAMKDASGFVSGKTVTLRIDNYNVDEYSETDLTACVVLKLADGTVIESTAVTMTFRGLMEQLNANYTALTAEQLNAVAEMIKKYAIIISWDLKNLIAL